MDNTVAHLDAFFSGRVQGVGFRYQTRQIAMGFEVSGYVQNLKDGRVRLEAEGNIVEINLFLDALKDELDHYIKEIEVHTSSRVPQLTGFLIS